LGNFVPKRSGDHAFIFAPQRSVYVWEFIQERSASRFAERCVKAFPTGGWEREKNIIFGEFWKKLTI